MKQKNVEYKMSLSTSMASGLSSGLNVPENITLRSEIHRFHF